MGQKSENANDRVKLAKIKEVLYFAKLLTNLGFGRIEFTEKVEKEN